MRDPVERLASHYHFWKSYDQPDPTHPLWRRFLEEQWSFERFCAAPELRNVYCQFLWGFPLDRFDFIGITEHFDEDIEFFSKHFLDGPVAIHRLNVNSARTGGAYVTNSKLRREIESCHKKDMALYCQAVEKRRARFST
jgi:hypothetical protein